MEGNGSRWQLTSRLTVPYGSSPGGTGKRLGGARRRAAEEPPLGGSGGRGPGAGPPLWPGAAPNTPPAAGSGCLTLVAPTAAPCGSCPSDGTPDGPTPLDRPSAPPPAAPTMPLRSAGSNCAPAPTKRRAAAGEGGSHPAAGRSSHHWGTPPPLKRAPLFALHNPAARGRRRSQGRAPLAAHAARRRATPGRHRRGAGGRPARPRGRREGGGRAGHGPPPSPQAGRGDGPRSAARRKMADRPRSRPLRAPLLNSGREGGTPPVNGKAPQPPYIRRGESRRRRVGGRQEPF